MDFLMPEMCPQKKIKVLKKSTYSSDLMVIFIYWKVYKTKLNKTNLKYKTTFHSCDKGKIMLISETLHSNVCIWIFKIYLM